MDQLTNGKSDSAALYLLSRMVADPRLAWLIGPGSTAYDRLTAEAAVLRGQTQAEFCAVHEPLLKFKPWPRADVSDGVGVRYEGRCLSAPASDSVWEPLTPAEATMRQKDEQWEVREVEVREVAK